MEVINNISNKNSLTRKLKILSIASAVVICSTMTPNLKTHANPLGNFFRSAWRNFKSGIRSLNPFKNQNSSVITTNVGDGVEPQKLIKIKKSLGGNFEHYEISNQQSPIYHFRKIDDDKIGQANQKIISTNSPLTLSAPIKYFLTEDGSVKSINELQMKN